MSALTSRRNQGLSYLGYAANLYRTQPRIFNRLASEAGRMARTQYNNYRSNTIGTTRPRNGSLRRGQRSKSYRSAKRNYKASKKRYKKAKKVQNTKKSGKLVKRPMYAQQKPKDCCQLATHTRRSVEFAKYGGTVDKVTYHLHDFCTSTILNSKMSEFRMVDNTATSAPFYVNKNPSAVTGTSNQITVKGIHASITIQANYGLGAWTDVYCLTPKVDSSILPHTRFTDGMDKQSWDADAYKQDERSAWLTDANDFNDAWTIKQHTRVWIAPGASKTLHCNIKQFEYDPAFEADHALTYTKSSRAACWVTRLCGGMGHHGLTPDLISSCSTRLDVMFETKYVFEYDAGEQLNDFSTDYTGGTPGGGVVTHRPTTTQQGLTGP